jgi:type IV secretory pathway TrbL component
MARAHHVPLADLALRENAGSASARSADAMSAKAIWAWSGVASNRQRKIEAKSAPVTAYRSGDGLREESGEDSGHMVIY